MFSRSSALPFVRAVLSVAGLAAVAGAASAQLEISRFTMGGGGATRSSGGTFGLGGTIGQPVAGRMLGGSFTLGGGFWGGGGDVATAVVDPPIGEAAASDAAGLPFRLYPARPNPVAGLTLVRFDLPRAGHARAAFYDVTGRLVRVLVNETLPAGRHQRTWDRRDGSGRTVSSGVYFLRLESGEHASCQKIVVVS